MRGTVARRLRQIVYGDDFSPRAKTYSQDRVNTMPGRVGYITHADKRRQGYQALKRVRTERWRQAPAQQ
ncbi:MAG TPA: hypothetical protein VM366_08925 [Anaerolineae bacterium]|nr:hypothetical protein [Anaerolineae bacterium]